jgi:serine/threonine protein kinase/dipeptidyl aminopeptidase/acylaminoacyl peptidase
MPLATGTRLGPYEILAPIGAGGMGEVYRARDTKLDRDVAIKVLPSALAQDPERLARFEREAKVLASLNHPNVAHLYGLEESNGIRALAMELVPGNTLGGPLPLETALNYARQIADALETAHEKGITHRDLKPANIMITPEGVVKVLDFGLASVPSREAGSDPSISPANSPTMTMAATQAGMIMGTAGYMSPEQAAGKVVDKRSDIWSFGVVLWEMLSGTRLFDGETISHTLADVLRAPIDFANLPATTPAAIRELLERCLDRDPRKRLRDIGEARIAITKYLANPTTGTELPPIEGRIASKWPWITSAVAALAMAAAAGLALVHFRETPPAEPVLHLSVPLPKDGLPGFLSLSPDGSRLVVAMSAQGKTELWLRALDSSQLQLLPGTNDPRWPFWSADGKSIGFFEDGKLKMIPASGGPPQTLCGGTGTGASGSWNRDGVILFSTSGIGDPLERVNAPGGACTQVTKPEAGITQRFPEFLPDGKHFVYSVQGGDEAKRGLFLAAMDDPTPRRLLADNSGAIFAPSTTGKSNGYLLFIRGEVLMAQPFNGDTLQLAGDMFPIATDVSLNLNAGIAASVSAKGTLVYESNPGHSRFQLTWMDRSGKDLGKIGTVQDQRAVALSPDGKSVATVRTDQGIWLDDLERGGETRFTSPELPGRPPVWSPDGKWIAFGSGNGLYLKDAGGGLKEELLLENGNEMPPSDWSRDGRYLVYTENDAKGHGYIWFLENPLSKSGERKPVKFQATGAMETQGQLSPDGRWLAYVSNESGLGEIYVRPFPSGPGRWKVSAGRAPGFQPRWRRDGKELFHLEQDGTLNRLMAVSIRPGPQADFQTGAPQLLFEFRAIGTVPSRNQFLYSPSPDGQRFLVNVQASDAEPTLNVITNWEAGLKK